ncbi:D-alanyl-D-alanine carboxypeptidase family protein [Curtobacterium sp. A7_M15]|uniref:D-alanyl-D-alanine carboxypeptidase family protein n=1 Tax=Curtobacterium sp. A7_M15 TaxID=3065241 RepID=UPI002737CA51|nr:D-alanyl-D-alanine carboxypeptidase family protein [Curtobacterium sp. A7_M15]MDP4332732.1 D-alanyl-D-alanine carboxypeptidase family protein [Curtobacterium sp. A7_M15]
MATVVTLHPARASAATVPADLRDLDRSMPEGGPSSNARSAAASTAAWGGYSNGEIPPTAMSPVPAEVGDPYLRPDAAAAYFDLSDAFERAFGVPLVITEAYRGLARQQLLWDRYQNGGNLAAYPGTSVHGWALACDFGGGVQTPGSTRKNWMNANAPAFGWQPRGDSFSSPEAWHFEYDGSYSPPPATVVDTAANQGNIAATDGAAVYFAGADGRLWNAYTNPGWNVAPIGGNVRALSPVVAKADGQAVYYAGPDNRVYNAYYNASGWNVIAIGGSIAAKSGLAVRDDGTAVYFAGGDGRLYNGYHNSSGWNFAAIGGSVRSGSPIATSTDGLAIFFVNSTGILTNAYYNASGWNVAPISGVTVDTDSGLATNAAGTTAYYRGTDGALYNAYHNATGWHVGKIGGSVRAKSPIEASSDGTAVDFIGADDQIYNAYQSPGWKIGVVGGSARAGSGLSANSDGTAIYYTGTDGRLYNAYQKPGWKIGAIGGSVRSN